MTDLAAITSDDGYFEDFTEGEIIRHARGKTVNEMDNVLITNMVMNTAEGHFNAHRMQGGEGHGVFNDRVVFGGINLSMVIGLAAQDTAEQAVREVGMTGIRLTAPVYHGDTLYAFSEVLKKQDGDDPKTGIVTFRHYGINQKDKLCVQADRTVELRRKG